MKSPALRRALPILLTVALVASLGLVTGTPVAATTNGTVHNVDQDAWYDTIQDAIDAAAPGDTIEVAAGEYVEEDQIVINKDLTITGEDRDTTIIKPAQDTGGTGDERGWFLVEAGNEFNLSNVTLDGEGKKVYQAIRSYGTGTIDNNIIKKMEHNAVKGYGVAAFGDMTISNKTFENIARIGVAIFDMSLFVLGAPEEPHVIVTGNTYTGKGEGEYIDYGIEVQAGAKATIEDNTITDCLGVVDIYTSAAIAVSDSYEAGGSEAIITGNKLTDNRYGIYVGVGDADTSEVTAHNNNISGNTEYGIKSIATEEVDATNNWWGDASGPSGEGPGTGDAVSTNVLYEPWLMEEDGAETTESDTDSGEDASASTTNVSATATGGDTDTTVTVAEYVDDPTDVDPGFVINDVFFFDVHVGGTLPEELVVVVNCPGDDCAGTLLRWFDGAAWLDVEPQEIVNGTMLATLTNGLIIDWSH